MLYRIKARGIIIKDNKLLCVVHKHDNLKIKNGNYHWSLPGGTLENGESIISCLKREMFEETGVIPKVTRLLFVHQFVANSKEYLEFFFGISNSDDYLNVDLTKTSHGLQEIEEIAFIDPAKNKILPKFLSEIQIDKIDLNNTPVQFFSYLTENQ